MKTKMLFTKTIFFTFSVVSLSAFAQKAPDADDDSEFVAPTKQAPSSPVGDKLFGGYEIKDQNSTYVAGGIASVKLGITETVALIMRAREDKQAAALLTKLRVQSELSAKVEFLRSQVASNIKLLDKKITVAGDPQNPISAVAVTGKAVAPLSKLEALALKNLQRQIVELDKASLASGTLNLEVASTLKTMSSKIAQSKLNLPAGAFENGEITPAGLELLKQTRKGLISKGGTLLATLGAIEAILDAYHVVYRTGPGVIPFSTSVRDGKHVSALLMQKANAKPTDSGDVDE